VEPREFGLSQSQCSPFLRIAPNRRPADNLRLSDPQLNFSLPRRGRRPRFVNDALPKLIEVRIGRPSTLETDLYPPIKRHLEGLGLEVKGEVCGCDLVALSKGSSELVVIGEMKQSFTLELLLQAVDRTSACDEVWLAVGASKRGRGRENDARVKKLCRLLGFGLLTVTVADGQVDVVVEPVPWKPRRDARRRSRIVEEHRRRKGDPVVGGSTRTPQMTAYRQQALAVANALASTSARPRDLRILAPDAAKILQANVYGWFER